MNKNKLLSGRDRGSILLICLLIMSLLSIIGMIALNVTSTELQAAGKQKVALHSFFSAEFGLSEAMRRLKVSPSSPDYMGDAAALLLSVVVAPG
jgi:Tfp pilus assembly protein PilX